MFGIFDFVGVETVLAVIAVVAGPSAWIADGVLGRLSFGVVGNYMLMLVGAFVGVYAIFTAIPSQSYLLGHPEWIVGSASIGAFTLVFLAGAIRRFTTS